MTAANLAPLCGAGHWKVLAYRMLLFAVSTNPESRTCSQGKVSHSLVGF